MKIALISTVHEASDVRIYHKHALTLAADGHEVTVFSGRAAKLSLSSGINIVKIKSRDNKFLRILFSTYDVFCCPSLLKNDIYHIFDPELVFTGFILKLMGKPVIYEVLENVRGMVESRRWIGNTSFRSFLAQITWFFDRLFYRCFDYIIVARPDLYSMYKRKSVVLINNYPDVDDMAIVTNEANYSKTKPVVLYSGGLTEIRGIMNLVKSMEYMTNDAELWLMGPWLEENIEFDCKKLNGYKKTKYIGSLPFGEHYAVFKYADIGVIPFLPSRNHNTTIPNKPFEYMMFNIPVAMSSFPYWKKVFRKMAFFFNPDDPVSIAETFDYIISHKYFSAKTAAFAREMVFEKMNWNREKKKIIRIYRSFS